MFRRILVANRGEIAVRIIRACRELGIESVAVYSDADRTALHVALANHAVRIGPSAPADSYLSIDAILAAAEDTAADAVHPGYGFLSERAAFARACADRGLTFIGPPAEAMERTGTKLAARALAAELGIPLVEGAVPPSQSDEGVAAAAHEVGFPLLLKPSAGGGGIGMVAVRAPDHLRDGIRAARREAEGAFGDGTLYVERFIDRPRHVEIQVFADAHGQVVHLFERECSLQRRHQKVVEESPSTAIGPDVRARMGAAAVALARAAGYRNAGTVEFLVERSGSETRFYFLEMNARLQVEHPVTEQITGLDLVRAQIEVASGAPLPWSQDRLVQRGHAVEVRVYAEDPTQGYLPQPGPLLLYRPPSMPGIRVDTGVTEGDEVTVHYDPLLAKLIATAETREAACARAVAALRDFPVLGVRTNISLLIAALEHPRFIDGAIDTAFLDEEAATLLADSRATPPEDVALIGAAVEAAAAAGGDPTRDPWTSLNGFRV